ncbi:MAG: TIGR00366 family protein [Chitinophagales bacterium]
MQSAGIIEKVKWFLPSPFTIALLLSVLTFLLAYFLTNEKNTAAYSIEVLEFWQIGFWDFLKFSMQMMLILVLGHNLAKTPFFERIIAVIVPFCSTNIRAAILVTFFAMAMAYLNWGLGLIFGAILARQVGEFAKKNKILLNYPLIAACSYTGLMIWHGGFSGSAPLALAESGHNLFELTGAIPVSETLTSKMNLSVVAITLVCLPLLAAFMAGKFKVDKFYLPKVQRKKIKLSKGLGAERLDSSSWPAYFFGLIILILAVLSAIKSEGPALSFLNLNYINFLLFGLALFLHGSIQKFIAATEEAMSGATGILLQFPIYAGIMGMIQHSGLIDLFSQHMIAVSTPYTFPIFTFISAGVVNIFVPSGGGQWIIQGPVLMEAARELGVPFSKTVMALAYGDQVTNMLQPFWALPLLAITGLEARDILPYTFLFFLSGVAIFTVVLLLF